MKENKATIADCPEWAKAECYRIVALASKGDFDTAYAAARQVAATPAPDEPPGLARRPLPAVGCQNPARPHPHPPRPARKRHRSHQLAAQARRSAGHSARHSLAYWWIDGLRFALEAQRLIDAGNLDEARNVVAALTQHGEAMAKTQAAAAASGERSAWIRAFRALEVLASDVRGRLALAGPKDRRGTAYNWFTSAADRQHPAPMIFPPMILTPMAIRLGEYYLAANQPDGSHRGLSAGARRLSQRHERPPRPEDLLRESRPQRGSRRDRPENPGSPRAIANIKSSMRITRAWGCWNFHHPCFHKSSPACQPSRAGSLTKAFSSGWLVMRPALASHSMRVLKRWASTPNRMISVSLAE